MSNIAAVEMSVGLRSAARLLVLRSREDVASRRECVKQQASNAEATTVAAEVHRINNNGRCLACDAERATSNRILRTQHSCSDSRS